MRKIRFVLAVMLVLVSAAAGQEWFKGSLDDALAKGKTEGKLVLLDFYSSG